MNLKCSKMTFFIQWSFIISQILYFIHCMDFYFIYCVTMHILQLTLITGLENYEQREPWTTTNEDNKTPFSLDQHEFPPIMKLVGVALETTYFASYPSKPRNCRGKTRNFAPISKPRCWGKTRHFASIQTAAAIH